MWYFRPLTLLQPVFSLSSWYHNLFICAFQTPLLSYISMLKLSPEPRNTLLGLCVQLHCCCPSSPLVCEVPFPVSQSTPFPASSHSVTMCCSPHVYHYFCLLIWVSLHTLLFYAWSQGYSVVQVNRQWPLKGRCGDLRFSPFRFCFF